MQQRRESWLGTQVLSNQRFDRSLGRLRRTHQGSDAPSEDLWSSPGTENQQGCLSQPKLIPFGMLTLNNRHCLMQILRTMVFHTPVDLHGIRDVGSPFSEVAPTPTAHQGAIGLNQWSKPRRMCQHRPETPPQRLIDGLMILWKTGGKVGFKHCLLQFSTAEFPDGSGRRGLSGKGAGLPADTPAAAAAPA